MMPGKYPGNVCQAGNKKPNVNPVEKPVLLVLKVDKQTFGLINNKGGQQKINHIPN